MKYAVILSLLFSFSAFAENQKCVDAFNKGVKLFEKAAASLERANKMGEDADATDNVEEKCTLIKLINIEYVTILTSIDNARKTTQESILYCNETDTKNKIIQNLNVAFDNYIELRDARAAVLEIGTNLNCF